MGSRLAAGRRAVIRRNVDLTYIVMDNQIYGLTKGQLSPTLQRGRKTVTLSFGSLEDPVNPLLYVMGYGPSFVAQGYRQTWPGWRASSNREFGFRDSPLSMFNRRASRTARNHSN